MPELTVARLFDDPPLFSGLPQLPKFTPDGRYVSYLRLADDDRERLDLWRVDLTSGEHELWVNGRTLAAQLAGPGARQETAAEQAARERRRQFARGITAYDVDPQGRYLLLPVDGSATIMTLADSTLRTLTAPGTRQTDVRFSPDGAQVSYVRDGNLYRFDLAADEELPLTADGGGTVSNGIADFIAQEEMHRYEGYWWSPDGDYVAYTRVDEAPVEPSQRFEIRADDVVTVTQRYPYPGAANADVRLLVKHLASGRTREIPYRVEQDDYLARVGWLGGQLAVQRQSRDQRTLDLYLFEPDSGNGERLLSESSRTWVNLHDNLLPLADGSFLWTSERTGRSHLYHYHEGTLAPLTSGEGRINRVHWADGRRALVSGWFDSPTEQHLFEISIAGAWPARRATLEAGWHEPTASSDGRLVLDRFSSLDQPARLDLLHLDAQREQSTRRTPLISETVGPDHPYFPYLPEHVIPDLGVLTADDGQRLHYRLTPPQGPRPDAGYPVIVYVYGGPGVQRVRNEWPPLLLQLLSRHGYGVLELDNRGSGNRSPRFEAPIHRRLGAIEVVDQVRGARYLATLPWVDAARIGVFGHSYGGYMTLMCLACQPDVFKAGVAVAPVTDWHLYDTHYTERYLETPERNPDGYSASSVLSHVAGLRGKLLLIHGMADDNVLYTHSTKLYRTLQASNTAFEMMAYPGSKHALQERDVSIHRFTLLLDFFGRQL